GPGSSRVHIRSVSYSRVDLCIACSGVMVSRTRSFRDLHRDLRRHVLLCVHAIRNVYARASVDGGFACCWPNSTSNLAGPAYCPCCPFDSRAEKCAGQGLTTRSTGPLAGGAGAPSARGRLAWFVRPHAMVSSVFVSRAKV